MQKTDFLNLECGCEVWSEGDNLYFKPHAFDCTYYLYFLEEGKRQGKPLEARFLD